MKERRGVYSVGVDLGGTRLRVQAVDRRGRPVRRHEAPAVPPKRLRQALKSLWRTWKTARPVRLTVGSKGVWAPAERRALRASLLSLADQVDVVSDVELAFESAFAGTARAAGILVLAGTGSIALARDLRGRLLRAGGLGPRRGDEGSGFWIGREYLRRRGRRTPGTGPAAVRKTAARAKDVLRRAERDALCGRIRREAQEHLAELARDLARRGRWKGTIPVAGRGGLFEDDGFRAGFWKALRAVGGNARLRPRRSRRDAALTAARWERAQPLLSPLPLRYGKGKHFQN